MVAPRKGVKGVKRPMGHSAGKTPASADSPRQARQSRLPLRPGPVPRDRGVRGDEGGTVSEPTFAVVGLDQIERRLEQIERRQHSLAGEFEANEHEYQRLVDAENVLLSEKHHLEMRLRQLLRDPQ
jgi:hypothetical protein